MRYYLINDIYPDGATFVKIIPMPQGEKIKLFAKCQELAKQKGCEENIWCAKILICNYMSSIM